MALSINTAFRNYIMDNGIVGALGTSAILKVYEGEQPGTAGAATTAALLVEITGIAFDAASDGETYNMETYRGTAGTSGTAGWGRLSGTDGTSYILDGGCGIGLSEDFIISTADITEDDVISLVDITLVQPGS